MSISISQLKDHSIAFGQARYSTSVVAKYLETVTIKKFKFPKTALSHDMIFNKEYDYTSDEKVEMLFIEYNIHYRDFFGSLIYILYARVD